MKLLTAGICVFFLAFATLRAARVPLTYDEAASYIRYVDTRTPSVFDTSALSIFNFEVATNHFLNTLFTKLCDAVAGGSEIVLRLPSLIGYAMFLGFIMVTAFFWSHTSHRTFLDCYLILFSAYAVSQVRSGPFQIKTETT